MTVSAAKKAADARWEAKQGKLTVRMPPEKLEALQQICKASGEPINKYINRLIDEDFARDK